MGTRVQYKEMHILLYNVAIRVIIDTEKKEI